MNNLGIYYYEQKEYKKMEKYYLMAIKKGEPRAMNNLGQYYKQQKEGYRKRSLGHNE
jgi:TPR repeat protein